jgi:hypothetical protein
MEHKTMQLRLSKIGQNALTPELLGAAEIVDSVIRFVGGADGGITSLSL